MKLDEAQILLERCAANAATMARNAVEDAVGELAKQQYRVAGSCILSGSGRATTELAAILASHPLIHTAEGDFFRRALRSACESCGLSVSAIRERELVSHAAAVFGISPEQVQCQASAMGKNIGPPWTHDEKFCAIAGWLVLASSQPSDVSEHSRVHLPPP